MRFPLSELLEVVRQAGVLKQMSERKCRTVTVDYVPARESMAIPRAAGEEEEPLEPTTPVVYPLTFTLEDAMFGGVIFVALTCADRVIINPFSWVSYEHLGTLSIDPRR